jgi:hypothetical protein
MPWGSAELPICSLPIVLARQPRPLAMVLHAIANAGCRLHALVRRHDQAVDHGGLTLERLEDGNRQRFRTTSEQRAQCLPSRPRHTKSSLESSRPSTTLSLLPEVPPSSRGRLLLGVGLRLANRMRRARWPWNSSNAFQNRIARGWLGGLYSATPHSDAIVVRIAARSVFHRPSSTFNEPIF